MLVEEVCDVSIYLVFSIFYIIEKLFIWIESELNGLSVRGNGIVTEADVYFRKKIVAVNVPYLITSIDSKLMIKNTN